MNARQLLEALRSKLDELPDPGPVFDALGDPMPNALDDARQITTDLFNLLGLRPDPTRRWLRAPDIPTGLDPPEPEFAPVSQNSPRTRPRFGD